MEERSKIAICGDVCSECPRYKATVANDLLKLYEVAKLWHKIGLRDKVLEPEELKCFGCNRDKACSHNINNCEHIKNKNNCGECDFFPCEKINLVFQKTENINKICKDRCTHSEYEELQKAFLMKREVLNQINASFRR